MHLIKDGKILCGATHVHNMWTLIESYATCEECFAVLDNGETTKFKIKENTYGTSHAEVSLVKILNEKNNKRLISKVGSIINRFESISKELSSVKNAAVRKYLLDIVKNDFWILIDNIDSDVKIKTHLKNVLTIRYRRVYDISTENTHIKN